MLSAGIALTMMPLAASPTVYDVKAFGAKGDGATLDTPAIQAAVDACSKAGGGVVRVGPGTYRTATVMLKDHVTLEIEKDALLEASPVASDWTGSNQPVIGALSCTDIGLQGQGMLDGGGMTYYPPNNDGHVVAGTRPETIVTFTNCQHVHVEHLTFRNSVKWTLVFFQCENLTGDGIIVRNRESCLNRETDGIDVTNCRHALIENCDIQTGDDALCVKLEGDPFQSPARPMHDVIFQNCAVATTCNATKIGTGTLEDAYDVHFRGITVNKLPNITQTRNSTKDGSCIAAISVQSNDGGKIHDFTFDDYIVNDCDTPIFMEVQNRKRADDPSHAMGSISDIMISNFTCLHSSRASQINVEKGGRLANITLNNLTIHNFGTSPGVASPPWLKGQYPDAERYGEMPAYGLFARCVDGLALTGKIDFIDDGHSGRPPTVFENVKLTPGAGQK
jgi:polygalacturonase